MRLTVFLLTTLAFSACCPGLVKGQRSDRPPEARAVAAALREPGGLSAAKNVLLQRNRTYSPAELEMVADSVMWLALRQSDMHSINTVAFPAVRVLAEAGRGVGGQPHQGSAERLLRIAMSDHPSSDLAIVSLGKFPVETALAYLRTVAAGELNSAAAAVQEIYASMGSEGRQLLCAMRSENEVTNRMARRYLEAIAQHHCSR